MKKLLNNINRGARRTLISGGALIAAVLAASVFLYLGAGRFLDYYGAMNISEKLLASVRPLGVAVCAGSLGIEYSSRRRENSDS